MRIHHISCGYFRPPCKTLTQGGGGLLQRAGYVVHCLLIVLDKRIVLVDTGLGRADMQSPLRSLGPAMAWGGGAWRGTSAVEYVRGLGFDPCHVTDVLMTHLDKDHAGGLADFPSARVHVHPSELQAARNRRGLISKQRYSPRHFAHGPLWSELNTGMAGDWHGFEAFDPGLLPGRILMVSLPGHSAGHCGVAIQTDTGWMLHCGDAVYHPAALLGRQPPFVIHAVESLLQFDAVARQQTAGKLRELVCADEVDVFCSHDPVAFKRLAG